MDNGQPMQSPEISDSEVILQSKNNSELPSLSPERDNRQIGNKVINTPESTPQGENNLNAELGKIISLEMPPIDKHKQPSDAEIIEKTISFNQSNIQTGDKLNDAAVNEINNALQKLNQDGRIDDFYDTVRGEEGMVTANIRNSYNREIGGTK